MLLKTGIFYYLSKLTFAMNVNYNWKQIFADSITFFVIFEFSEKKTFLWKQGSWDSLFSAPVEDYTSMDRKLLKNFYERQRRFLLWTHPSHQGRRKLGEIERHHTIGTFFCPDSCKKNVFSLNHNFLPVFYRPRKVKWKFKWK